MSMADESDSLHLERPLGVARDVSDNTLENLRLLRTGGAHLGIKVQELDLFSPEVVAKPSKLAPLVLLAGFVGKGMAFNAFPHLGGFLFQSVSHFGATSQFVKKRRPPLLSFRCC